MLGGIDREESIHLFANDNAQVYDPVSDWVTIHRLQIIHILPGNHNCNMLITALVKLVDSLYQLPLDYLYLLAWFPEGYRGQPFSV